MTVGKAVLINSADAFREHDLVSLGNGTIVNTGAVFRTHTFEDWLLKMDPIEIGAECIIGHNSTILPLTTIEASVEVGDNSLVLKGERLLRGHSYRGLPSEPQGRSTATAS